MASPQEPGSSDDTPDPRRSSQDEVMMSDRVEDSQDDGQEESGGNNVDPVEPPKRPTDEAAGSNALSPEHSNNSAGDPEKPTGKETKEEESSSLQSLSSSRSSTKYPTIELRLSRRPGHHYKPVRQTKYLNNLMPIVGFLELTNALDFPANVWNQTPVPTFAIALMITGGTIAILASFLAFRDLYKSITNFRLLREERVHLLQEKTKWESAGDPQKTSMMQAWLDLNFREALWEAAERMLMDSLNGFAGIIVGIGTILAVDGANPASYDASNLLSGYIGNSFNVVYGALNTAFAIYMFTRSQKHSREVSRVLPEGGLKKQVLSYMKKHRIYAVVNGVTVFVSAIGSMVSAKHWQGYVVLIPCVIGAIVGNFFWRHLVGYDRDFCQIRPDAAELDAEKRLRFSIDAAEVTKTKGRDQLLANKSGSELLQFMAIHGMMVDFTASVMHDIGDRRQRLITRRQKRHVEVEYDQLATVDEALLLKSASKVLHRVGHRRFRDEVRMFSELWSSQLAQSQPGRSPPTMSQEKPGKEEV